MFQASAIIERTPSLRLHFGQFDLRHAPLLGVNDNGLDDSTQYYASTLKDLNRCDEVRSVLRKTIPMARRVLGESTDITLKMRWLYALALFEHDAATLDDLREAVDSLDSVARLWTRVFGASHPETPNIQLALNKAREALATRAA